MGCSGWCDPGEVAKLCIEHEAIVGVCNLVYRRVGKTLCELAREGRGG